MEHSFNSLMQRLSRAGFKKDFVARAILPEWWSGLCEDDAHLLADIEIRVARFLGQNMGDIRDPSVSLRAPQYAGARLRRVRAVDKARLAPAIHAATSVASAVIRNLRETHSEVRMPPRDGLLWRRQIASPSTPVRLEDLVEDLWQRGIPVIPMEELPAPSFQGMACIVEGRPAMLLGHKFDEPGRVAFYVAHETSHLVAGDCSVDQPVVDDYEGGDEQFELEAEADKFAISVLTGSSSMPELKGQGHRQLAKNASEAERERGVDASVLIFGWAFRTSEYATAAKAVKALYRSSGARCQLRASFDTFVDLDQASDTDRTLMRCIYGDPEGIAGVD